MDTEAPQLTVSRVFDAPRDLVYQAFTDPDQLAAWWGPIGNSLSRDEIEVHDEPDERTRLEIRQWLPEDLAGPSEQGWLQAFTKLDAILTTDPATAAVHRNGATWAS
jgi:hypothetical protein